MLCWARAQIKFCLARFSFRISLHKMYVQDYCWLLKSLHCYITCVCKCRLRFEVWNSNLECLPVVLWFFTQVHYIHFQHLIVEHVFKYIYLSMHVFIGIQYSSLKLNFSLVLIKLPKITSFRRKVGFTAVNPMRSRRIHWCFCNII